MKFNKLYVFTYLLICTLSSCEKDNNNSLPECDINGVWIGEWESNQEINGTFCANVIQNITDFSGNIVIRINEPDDGYYNLNFGGTVKNKNVETIINVRGTDIVTKSEINNDSLVSGNFDVPDLSVHGTFIGKKLLTTEAILTEIYSSPQDSEQYISDFIYIDNSLWVFTFPPEWIDDVDKTKVYKYNLDGRLTETTHYQPVLYNDIASDGQYIWNLTTWNTIFKYDTYGNKIDSLEITENLEIYSLACNSSNLFLLSSTKIHKTDHSLGPVDIINTEYTFPAAYINYKNYHLYSSGNVLYKMNSKGKLIHAYIFPDERSITDIETNGNRVWCLVNWFDRNSGNDNYTIYEIDLNN